MDAALLTGRGKKPLTSEVYRLTRGDLEEMARCHPRGGIQAFERFCHKHVKIPDKKHGRAIPFEPRSLQLETAEALINGEWVLIVKARQLGLTTVLVVYSYWQMAYRPYYTVTVINQNKYYAEEFVDERVRFTWAYMPPYLRHPLLTDSQNEIKLGSTVQSKIVALAGNEKAARSLTQNLLICDEGAYIENLRECRKAAEPTLEETGGQSAIISTANGPHGDFYDEYKLTVIGKSKYRLIFFPWHAHPRRDKAWYRREAEAHASDPNYMLHEYPETPEQAFMSSGGRIYPHFSSSLFPEGHKLRMPLHTFDNDWKRFRGIDPGESASAFVCLWVVVIPSDTNRLTYDPSCENFEREMLGYCYDVSTSRQRKDDDAILKKDDHCPDALRMIVSTYDLEKCHVHVYREYYIANSVGKGYTTQRLLSEIKTLSGYKRVEPGNTWEPTRHVEEYEGTVYDRAKPRLEVDAMDMGIDMEPHTKPADQLSGRDEEVKNGIMMVRNLIADTLPRKSVLLDTDEQKAKELQNKPDVLRNMLGIRSTGSIQMRILRNQRRRRKQQQRMRRGRSAM